MNKNKDILGRDFPKIKGRGVYVDAIHEKEKIPVYKAFFHLTEKHSGNYLFTYISEDAKVLYSNKNEDFAELVDKDIDLLELKNLETRSVNNFSTSSIDCIWDADENVLYIKKQKNMNIKVNIK